MKNKFLILAGFLFLLVGAGFLSSYQESQVAYSSSGSSGFSFSAVDEQECVIGQDFIIQVDPFGCTPAVVRTDLLEEQDVKVFCQLRATKVNPLIDVKAIKKIDFVGSVPDGVRGIGFFPSRFALGDGSLTLDSPVLDNIGYAVIVLKQQSNSSALTNCGNGVCWIGGNLTAKITYDIENAFGVGAANFYLPEMSDSDWAEKYTQSSFWKGKGFLRAEDIDSDSVIIKIYDEGLREVNSFDLKTGEQSSKMYLSGFDCLAGLQVKLNSLVNPDTTVKLEVNGEILELRTGETFENEKCRLNDIKKLGLVEEVSIKCEDEGGFKLRKYPKVSLVIDGVSKEYEVGDYLYSYVEGAEERFVYLGYAGTKGNTNLEKDLEVLLIEFPNIYVQKLSESDLWTAKTIAEGGRRDSASGKGNFINFGKQVLGYVSGTVLNVWKWTVDGEHHTELDLGASKDVGTKSVNFFGMADPKNVDLESETSTYYQKAIEDYDTVIDNFKSLSYPETSDETLGERSYFGKIKTAYSVSQMSDVKRFCEDFYETYPESKLKTSTDEYCNDFAGLSSTDSSFYQAVVDNEIKEISFKGSREPSFNDFGAVISVRNSEGQTFDIQLLKDEVYYLGESEGFIQLLDLGTDSAKIRLSLDKNFFNDVKDVVVDDTETLILNQPNTFGSKYSFTVTQINLKKVAKVSVKPSIDYTGSEAPFSFKIGIEKRGIALAPEKIASKIKTLESSIAELEDLSDKLGNLVTGLKTACFATNAVLTIKNFLGNLDGKAIARQSVMRDSGGWYERCTLLTNKGTYTSVDQCISDNSGKIEQDVKDHLKYLQEQNNLISEIQKKYEKGGILGDNVVDSEGFEKEYLEKIKPGLLERLKSKFGNDSIKIGGDDVDLEEFVDNLDSKKVSFDDIRELDLYSKMDGAATLDETALKRLAAGVGDVYKNTETINHIEDLAEDWNVDSEDISFIVKKDAKEYPYKGKIYRDIKNKVKLTINSAEISDSTPVAIMPTSDGEEFVATLNKYGDKYNIENLYLFNGTPVNKERAGDVYFKFYDSKSYENRYTGSSSSGDGKPVARYYETEPYVGLPAIVPFDLKNGWYASVDQTLGVLGSAESYTKGGRVQSFYVCNVGENGIEDNRNNDDVCRLVNTYTGEAYDVFPGLNKDDARDVIRDANLAVEQASTQYGKSEVIIDVGRGKVVVNTGEPAVSIPDLECEDIMSVADCKILFNVCDPVICPSSRCDLGGKYPVANVIGSGIIGSLALCAPNFVGVGGDVYIPVCLSGVKAGLDSWISVQKSYRDCLKQNLETGATVGICDEINSIYQCEFFWRQGLPLANLAIPRALEFAKGQSSAKGGGEYLGVQSAWDNAGKSVDYFTQYYAENSFNAFKVRSTEEAGGELCKVFVSGVLPTSSDGLSSLVQPDSPSQFTGWFDEIPYTTATNPPTSQYKVFYHIYAGDDSGVQYRVYLKGSADSSFYQDTANSYQVASGYIAPGEYASETRDFTSVSGYKELCIMINDRLECGFKEVSTDFGLNYLKEKGIAEMAKDEVSSTKECVSGSANIYTLLNPQNPQEKVEDAASVVGLGGAQIYNYGVTRICASDNPGKATDLERWTPVGTCDDENMICWLDTESVENAIKNAGLEEDVLSESENKTVTFLQNQGYYLDEGDFEGELSKIKASTPDQKIKIIGDMFDKVVYNHQKAYLLFLRGESYWAKALVNFWQEEKEKIEKVEEPVTTAEALEKIKNELVARGHSREELDKLSEDELLDLYQNEIGDKEGNVDVNVPDLSEAEELIENAKGYILFEFQDGTVGGNSYFRFVDGEWEWSQDNDLWTKISSITSTAGFYKKDIPFLEAMKGKSYSEGLKLLLLRTIKNEEGGILPCWLGGCTNLVTDTVEMNYEGKFKFKEKIGGNDLYLIFADTTDNAYFNDPSELIDAGSWFWSTNGDDYAPFLILENVKSSYGQFDWKYYSDYLSSLYLVNKSFYQGAEIIFDFERKEYYNFGSRDLQTFVSTVKEKISQGVVPANCEPYLEIINEFGNGIGVDPFLLLSVMIRESNCNSAADSGKTSGLAFSQGASYGLMQISGRTWCGKYGLPQDQNDCTETLLKDPNANIRVGARILKEYANTYGSGDVYEKTVLNYCSVDEYRSLYLSYKDETNRALRAYNGFGCISSSSDVYYVEKVLAKYNELT